jgi:hypothetical protein
MSGPGSLLDVDDRGKEGIERFRNQESDAARAQSSPIDIWVNRQGRRAQIWAQGHHPRALFSGWHWHHQLSPSFSGSSPRASALLLRGLAGLKPFLLPVQQRRATETWPTVGVHPWIGPLCSIMCMLPARREARFLVANRLAPGQGRMRSWWHHHRALQPPADRGRAPE